MQEDHLQIGRWLATSQAEFKQLWKCKSKIFTFFLFLFFQTREKYDGDMRGKLLGQTEDIYGMNKKLDNIERTGQETVGIMANANQDLYG